MEYLHIIHIVIQSWGIFGKFHASKNDFKQQGSMVVCNYCMWLILSNVMLREEGTVKWLILTYYVCTMLFFLTWALPWAQVYIYLFHEFWADLIY